MNWHNIVSGFLQLNVLQLVISQCLVYQIPPQLPCVPPGMSDLHLPAGVSENYSNLNEKHNTSKVNVTALVDEDNFLCCHWSDTHINCFVYTAKMETKAFTYSESSALTSQKTDSIWNLQFWSKENTEELFCIVELPPKSAYLNEEFTVNLLYALTDVSLEGFSTNSLKDNFTVTQCNTLKHQKYRCRIPSIKLNQTYVMWLKITNGIALLQSPLMTVRPIDIVKLEPPLHLQLEVTDKGQIKISWSSPLLKSYPVQYEVKCSANSTKNVWQVAEITMETSLIISNALLDSSYVIQVRCKAIHRSSLWSDWSTLYNLTPQDVMYFPPKILASVGTNVSFYCIYKTKNKIISSKKIAWWLNLAKEIPRSQYTLVNDYIGKVTLVNLNPMKPGGNFLFNALYCCNENKECNHRYAELYIVDVNFNITCETYGNLQKMTCRWSTSTNPLLLESTLQLRYYRSDVYCPESPTISSDSEIKECRSQRNNFYECVFQPFYLLSGYTMWIEIKHTIGTIASQPVCILPKEVVKPFSPSIIKAEITRETGQLKVTWNNPALPKNDLQFQIRYAVNGIEVTWELHEVSATSVTSVGIDVQDLCAVYVVQVRCSVIDGTGYWSDWSRSAYTVVKDVKAPLRGPEFWRIVNEDPARNQKNVTLFWKPLMKNLSLCSVIDYVVEHNTSENITWSDYLGNDTTYTFPWTENVHTVKILAVNSIGTSSVNFIITLSQQISTVSLVKSLSAYSINSSCVIISWTLSRMIYDIASFVIEWSNLSEEQIKWITVPSNTRKYYIYDNFILIEKYRFSLYPIIPEGVTRPTVIDGFSQGVEKQKDANFYVIAPLVISCSVLLLVTLLILHQRMKTLFWEDVPNPKNCSWAQGVNFQKPETFEHLFLKHPEALFGPLLLEPEIVLEDVSIDKAVKNEDLEDLLATDSLFVTIQDLEHDSACSSGQLNSNSLSENLHEAEISERTTGQSNVKYATIISNSMSSGLYEPPENSSDSFDRCFLGHDSLLPTLSNSSWAVGKQMFLILPSCHLCPPSKTLSLSVDSSEGFSEALDQDKMFAEEHCPEREVFCLGMSSIKRSENDVVLTENSNILCHFHANALFGGITFPQNTSSALKPFINKCEAPVQNFLSYVPQFQTLTIKVHATASSKA